MPCRPSATASLMSDPSWRRAPLRSDDTRSGLYRSMVCRTKRISQNDMPKPKPTPTTSQNSRLNTLGAPPESASGTGGAGAEGHQLDHRVGEGQVGEPRCGVDGARDRLRRPEQGVDPFQLGIGLG